MTDSQQNKIKNRLSSKYKYNDFKLNFMFQT
jgi:hypothetical protein